MGAKFNQVEVTTPAAAAAHSPRKDQMETAISAAVDAAVDGMDAALADGLAGKANATMTAIRTLLSGGNGTLDFSGFTVTLPEGMLIQFRSGTQEELDEADPLAVAEPAWTTDSKILYIGTGATNQPVLMANLVGGAGYQVVANKFQFTSATEAVKFTASGFAVDTLCREDGAANAGGLGTVSASQIVKVKRGAGGTGTGTVRAGGAISVTGFIVQSGAAAVSNADFPGGAAGAVNVPVVVSLQAGNGGYSTAFASGSAGGDIEAKIIVVKAGAGGGGGGASGTTGGVGGSIDPADGLIVFEAGAGGQGSNGTADCPGGSGSFAPDTTPRLHFKGGAGSSAPGDDVGERGGYTGKLSFVAGDAAVGNRGGDCGAVWRSDGGSAAAGGRGGDGGVINLSGASASAVAPGLDGGNILLTEGVNQITTSKAGGGHTLSFPNYADGVFKLRADAVKVAAVNHIVGHGNEGEPWGGVIYVSDASNLYLPHAESGMSMKVILTAAVAVNIVPMSTEKIYLNGVALDDGDEIEASTLNAHATITAYNGDWWVISTGFADGGVGTQWSPADLGADLVFGVRGTLGNTVNNAGGAASDTEAVKWFANTYAGNAKQTTGGLQPIQRPNGLQFDGVDDSMVIGPTIGAATPLEIKFDAPYAVFGVVNLEAGSDMVILGNSTVGNTASLRYLGGTLAVYNPSSQSVNTWISVPGGVTPFFASWGGYDRPANLIDAAGRDSSSLMNLTDNAVCDVLGFSAESPASHANNRFLLVCAVNKEIEPDSYEFDRLNDYLLSTFGVALPGA